jgi:hypothetical protein
VIDRKNVAVCEGVKGLRELNAGRCLACDAIRCRGSPGPVSCDSPQQLHHKLRLVGLALYVFDSAVVEDVVT